PPLRRALRARRGPRRGQRDGGSHARGDGPLHGSEPAGGHPPDRPGSAAPVDPLRTLSRDRRAPARAASRHGAELLPARRRQLGGAQRDPPPRAVRPARRAPGPARHGATRRRDPEPRLRRGGAPATSGMGRLAPAPPAREPRGRARQPPGFRPPRPPLGAGEPPASASPGNAGPPPPGAPPLRDGRARLSLLGALAPAAPPRVRLRLLAGRFGRAGARSGGAAGRPRSAGAAAAGGHGGAAVHAQGARSGPRRRAGPSERAGGPNPPRGAPGGGVLRARGARPDDAARPGGGRDRRRPGRRVGGPAPGRPPDPVEGSGREHGLDQRRRRGLAGRDALVEPSLRALAGADPRRPAPRGTDRPLEQRGNAPARACIGAPRATRGPRGLRSRRGPARLRARPGSFARAPRRVTRYPGARASSP